MGWTAAVRKELAAREPALGAFYTQAAAQTRDIPNRDLLFDLALIEQGHGGRNWPGAARGNSRRGPYRRSI